MGRVVAAVLLACAAPAAAATWSCDERHEVLGKTLVLARCTAHGTYTAGGDPIGAANPGVDLCNSDNRIPVAGMASAAESGTTGQGYLVTYGRTTGRMYFLTAGDTPGKGNALVELNGGTSVEGATVMMLTLCK
jgi:hypothetical protein